MGETTKIEWCDHTFNPWRGCTKIAAGCEHCYAATFAAHNPGTLGEWGDRGTRVVASESMWSQPLKWNAAAERDGVRRRVFCASLADVFEDWDGQVKTHNGLWAIHNRRFGEETDFGCARLGGGSDALYLDGVRRRLFRLIDATPNLDWLLLTKRPENIPAMIPTTAVNHLGWNGTLAGYWHLAKKLRPNVWLGTSIANQGDADRNIPLLLKCRDLSPVLFVSAEPLLGPVDLFATAAASHGRDATDEGWSRLDCLDWLIVGGESGPYARPMHPDWARGLRDQCQAAGVPFFFKQWGEWAPGQPQCKSAASMRFPRRMASGLEVEDGNGQCMSRVGKKAAGRLLDGREWSEFPKGVNA